MYLDFFGLREQPFGVTPDPAFLYLSQTHRDALAAFRSGLMTDRGFMALVGEPGLGKTTLLYKLIDEWRQSCRVVFLFQTQCDSREFFRYLLAELGVDAEAMGLVTMHHHLNHFLFQEMLAGKRFILIVDEAQNLDDSVLETVRLLSNFETQHAKLLNIVLSGQPQLAEKLAAPGLQQLRQRIAVMSRIRPLTPDETTDYIRHRLDCAGHRGDALFTPGALEAISKGSQGAPRNINNICHQALCAGAMTGNRTVDLEIVQNVIARLEGREIEVAPRPAETPVDAPAAESAIAPAEDLPASPAEASTQVASSSFAAAAAAASPVVRPAPSSVPMLSYGTVEKPRSKRWRFGAIASGIVVLTASSYAVPPVRRFAQQEYKSLTPHALAAPDSSAVPGPQSSLGDTLPAFDPAPQDNDSGQVITVAPKAGQTIEELSRLYAGHYDAQLDEQIYALNPDLKDPENLEAGQLIRLPLPPGTLKKVLDTSDAPKPGTFEAALDKVKELFAAKH